MQSILSFKHLHTYLPSSLVLNMTMDFKVSLTVALLVVTTVYCDENSFDDRIRKLEEKVLQLENQLAGKR